MLLIIDMINISPVCHQKLIVWMTTASVALSFEPQSRGCYMVARLGLDLGAWVLVVCWIKGKLNNDLEWKI